MNKQIKKNLPALVLGGAALLFTGCETVTRENIISSIDTGFGATVMENKQTQVPEIKVGYIRSQFYSIPTGKVVKNAGDRKNSNTNGVASPYFDHQTNAANTAPNLVAGIRTKSSFGSLLFGLEIDENFAVGDRAVMSPAAVAMYITSADDPKTAQAASDAVQGKDSAKSIAKTLNDPTHRELVDKLNKLVDEPLTKQVSANKTDFAVGAKAGDYADALAAEKDDTLGDIRIKTSREDDLKEIVDKLTDATTKP